ncbi:MAG: hypothetical protein KDA24_17285 [Deltaproteobacteria bacterium]|nr:hypothetical protein [Deltaproteobacteria bacterium]
MGRRALRWIAPLVLALLAGVGCPTTAPPDDFPPIIDPLSRPAEPTLAVSSFMPSSECADCHPDHVDRWSTSSHAYAMVDPVFRALVEVRRADHDGAQDTFCLQCHTAIGTRGGEIVPGFDWDALSPVVQEGVTCEACHKVAALERTWNSGHVLDEGGPMYGPLQDPEASALHEFAYSDLHTQSAFCAGCHEVVELDGLPLERPYSEWLESPAADAGQTCQDCHMPSYEGPAAEGGPPRTLHDHRFVGIDVPLAPGFATEGQIAEVRARILELIDGSASLELRAEPVAAGQTVNLVATVHNHIDGHNLPTGSTFIRQMWLELEVRDADGAVVFQTGHLDDNGDLRNHWSALDPYGDPNLITYGSGFTDPSGAPELFPWRASEHTSASIPPQHDRTSTFFVPTTAATNGPLEVTARVRLRTHPPFLLRALGLDELIPSVETYDLAVAQTTVELTTTTP